ncbi:tail fiber assembly protein [Photorhabdus tasmaniensis]|uniref:Tail fiber assembly protein n=1 Tax=Photorhabdus tasmaniensis TaxID=1004159 RepID=A0ABX0GMR7_9GAMM|nr:tail fiber assembly protein [Photorhabdus tasmaniensis]NHB90448.1 hypothetical protein [Photorhabdus tasmaniensis]
MHAAKTALHRSRLPDLDLKNFAINFVLNHSVRAVITCCLTACFKSIFLASRQINARPKWKARNEKKYIKYRRLIEERKGKGFAKLSQIMEVIQKIAPLQYSADTGMESEEEKGLLLEWKKYRVLLNRIDVSSAPDINWSEKPME